MLFKVGVVDDVVRPALGVIKRKFARLGAYTKFFLDFPKDFSQQLFSEDLPYKTLNKRFLQTFYNFFCSFMCREIRQNCFMLPRLGHRGTQKHTPAEGNAGP